MEFETDTPFDPAEWIGQGKVYRNLPSHVTEACAATRQLPSSAIRQLPMPDLSVADFLGLPLPAVLGSDARVPKRTSAWFSRDPPNFDDAISLESIPSLDLVRQLETDLSQSWLNGDCSIVDHTNNSRRLPLWAVQFFRQIHGLRDAQQKWEESRRWLPDYEKHLLYGVSWNTTHLGAPDGQLDWTRLISDEWLSGGIIDEIMRDIKDRLAADPVLSASTFIAPLAFQFYISRLAEYGDRPKYLKTIVAAVQSGKTRLLFPIHYNNNHWMAFSIDFAARTFGYGDSYVRGSKPKRFIEHLRCWLALAFPGDFTSRGDFLEHSIQRDFIHCGVYTANTIERALFGTPCLKPIECSRARIDWFKMCMSKADSPDAMSDPSFPAIDEVTQAFAAECLDNHVSRPSISIGDLLNPESSALAAELSLDNIIAPHSSMSLRDILNPDEAESRKPDVSPVPPPSSQGLDVSLLPPAPVTQIPDGKKAANKRKAVALDGSDDSDDSDEERKRFHLLTGSARRAKETVPRAKKRTVAQRKQAFLDDPNTVKTSDGLLQGDPHTVYCRCKPRQPRKLESEKMYAWANWETHRKHCELVTRVKAGIKTTTVKAPLIKSNEKGPLYRFFAPSKVAQPAANTTSEGPKALVMTAKRIIPADTRLDAAYFAPSASAWSAWRSRPIIPRIELPEPIECEGLHGDGYQQYAWQTGDYLLGGVSALAWIPFAHHLFPYKNWRRPADDSDNSDSDNSDPEGPTETIPHKVLRDACELTNAVTLATSGVPEQANKNPQRSEWTEYEKRRLHHTLLVAARWITNATTGSVFAKGCERVTTNLSHTCSACTAVGQLEGLKRAVRDARARAKLPADEFTQAMKRKLTYTPLIRSEIAAADAKASLASPGVMKILSSKAKYGPIGVFLTLYQQGLSEKVVRESDPTKRAIHGMRYDPLFVKCCTIMRSYGPRSGAQYDLWSSMTGGISQRQMRRRVAKSATRMLSPELCAGNLFPALAYAKLMDYTGPWICAGDGTKLRPLLTMSTEFSEKGSAHVVGSTLPLQDCLFSTSEEQSRIISDVETGKAIASQVWVLGIHIPLPGTPVFPVAFIANKGKLKAEDYRDQHLKLRRLCGEAGMKLLASGADGAKSEVKAQLLMMNAETPERLSYTNKQYGVFLSCPVYSDTGPHIATTDPDHARKTARNNFLYGTHLLTMGFVFLCHAILMFLLTFLGVGLYIKDIFNADKQDDGAARRLFTNVLFGFLVDTEGQLKHPSFEGLFILTFVFGELFDAWMKRGMPHIERVVCVFRARHFLTIWRYNVLNAEERYPDLFQKQSSFLADSSFQILMRLSDQLILLMLAHLEYYPDVPFMPWHHGTHFLEHFFGIARSFMPDFSFGQLIEMYKHILIRQRILSSGQFSTKREKDSNNGYIFDFVDSGLKPEEIAALKDIPSRADIDRACDTAWIEAAALASQFGKMQIPTLPLQVSDLHPQFRAPNGKADLYEPSDDEEDVLKETDIGVDAKSSPPDSSDPHLRIPHTAPPAAVDSDDTLPGSSLSSQEALTHASHHVLAEQYLADKADEDEIELAAIEERLHNNPETEKNRVWTHEYCPISQSHRPALPYHDGSPLLLEPISSFHATRWWSNATHTVRRLVFTRRKRAKLKRTCDISAGNSR
ncbi:hypothetical protein C8F01DRAFT_1331915 [Mycena amicta]|nr:hypothetical protein C8F01DRAFT_1331915 [Mycena amicta]